MSKRKRSASEEPADPSPCSAARRDGERRYVEEIVEEDDVKHILLRFPCFDFFRDVHLCEMAVETEPRGEDCPISSSQPRQQQVKRSDKEPFASQELEQDQRVPGRSSPPGTRFCPAKTVQFVAGTLETSHPHLVVNAGQGHREMLFRGVWEPAESLTEGRTHTNRAIVGLSVSDLSTPADPLSERTEDPVPVLSVSAAAAAGVPSCGRPASGEVVQSLLPHPKEGLTADESRARREEQKHSLSWRYEEVIVPSAILVMHRYR